MNNPCQANLLDCSAEAGCPANSPHREIATNRCIECEAAPTVPRVRRAPDSFSSPTQTDGGGPDSRHVVDYRLAAVLAAVSGACGLRGALSALLGFELQVRATEETVETLNVGSAMTLPRKRLSPLAGLAWEGF